MGFPNAIVPAILIVDLYTVRVKRSLTMITIQTYTRAKSLEEAYQLNQNRRNRVIGGMLWVKTGSGSVNTAIDLCDLGLDSIEENDEAFTIGASVTLRQLETHERLAAYTCGAVRNAVKDIVGVQFRNMATVGGSIWGRFGFSDVLTVFLSMDCDVELYRGGVMPLDKDYLQSLERICRERDILLICDEVQTGNGRSGKLYGYMNYGIFPDIVSTAKGLAGGLPLGATLFSEKTKDVLTPGSHGSTFGGNPICCAGAINILSRLDEKTLAGVRERSEYIFSELSGAPGIKEVSGLGLMIGIKTEKDASEVINACIKKGVLIIKAKDKVRLLPALNIPMELLEQAVGVIKEVCADKEA